MILYASSFDQYGLEGPVSSVALEGVGRTFPMTSFLKDKIAAPTIFDTKAGLTTDSAYEIGPAPWGRRGGRAALLARKTTAIATGSSSVPEATSYELSGSSSARLTIPGDAASVRQISFAFGLDSLPVAAGAHGLIVSFVNVLDLARGYLAVLPSGRLALLAGPLRSGFSSVGPPLGGLVRSAVSATPLIEPGRWYAMTVVIDTSAATTLDVDVYLHSGSALNNVLSATGLLWPTARSGDETPQPEILHFGLLPISAGGSTAFKAAQSFDLDKTVRGMRDVVISDASGSYNTGVLGQTRVALRRYRGDVPGGGWTVTGGASASEVLNDLDAATGITAAAAQETDVYLARMTPDTTAVLGMQVTAEGAKSDGGAVSVRTDLVRADGTAATGGALDFAVNTLEGRQIFEDAPATLRKAVDAGRLRFKRVS